MPTSPQLLTFDAVPLPYYTNNVLIPNFAFILRQIVSPIKNRRLTLEDIHLCKSAEQLLQLFNKLGYLTESDILPLSKNEIGFAPSDLAAIRRLALLADQAGQLQVILFELDEIALTRLRSLSANFLSRGGNYLIVATQDYSRLVFVNPRREAGKINIRKLVVDTTHPTRHDLDILEAIAANGQIPEAVYQTQCEAFDVEKVTNRFYSEYAGLFKHTQEVIKQNNPGIKEFYDSEKLHAFTQRLLGRLMFLYFIQKKGWLAGNRRFLDTQYRIVSLEEGNYYSRVLEPLFFDTLNQRRKNDESTWGRIPYLNGGLFEQDYDPGTIIYLPNELFDPGSDVGILGFFNNYNFTIAEDTPAEQEVAVDPEMLGKVFENMMEEQDRGKSGTFYTPRPIVHYMCREALLGYLEEQTSLDRELLAAQFEEEPEPKLSVAQSRKVETAVDVLRVLDPAVGTGAFLVGVLHELVTLKHACYQARGVDVRRSTSEVAGWKRDFIANCLHGVDIKPGAIDIARLRLWLSLVVDLELDQVEPLPNLDYKLRVGNSLLETVEGERILPDLTATGTAGVIEPFQGSLSGVAVQAQQMGFNFGAADQARTTLAQLKERFFASQDPADRKRLRGQIETQERSVVIKALDEITANLDTRIKIIVDKGSLVNWKGMTREQKDLEKLIQRKEKLLARRHEASSGLPLPFFLFRLHFFEVFRDRGGFDIIIANPPYVRQELIGDQKNELAVSYPDVYDGVADLFVYFYARGLDLLRENGMLAFISSNKYMRAGYGRKLRELLSEKNRIQTLIDFGDLSVFEAIAYPSIIVVRKSLPFPGHTPRILTVDSLDTLEHLGEVVTQNAWTLPQVNLLKAGWTLERPEILHLMEKIRCVGRPLEQVVQSKFYRGIVTGSNEAFVIDDETRERLIVQDPRSGEAIKPWLRGRDIKRWQVDWRQTYLIYTTWDFKIADYPAIHAHLEQFHKELAGRPEVKQGRFPWFALSRYGAEYAFEFLNPKIIYPHFNTTVNFAFDQEGRYCNDKSYIIPTDDLSLLAILNSSVNDFLIRQLSPAVQQGYMEFRTTYVGQLSVPDLDQLTKEALSELVQKVLDAPGEEVEVRQIEQEIDEIVGQAFGLNTEERSIIEGSI